MAEAGDPAGEPVVLLHGFPELSPLVAAPAPGAGRGRLPRRRPRPARLRRLGPPGGGRGLRGAGAGGRRRRAHPGPRPRERPRRRPRLGRLPRLGAGGRAGPRWSGSLTILNAPQGPVSARLRREDRAQQAKSWYMLLFQFPGVAEAWLSDDDFANLRAFVFGTAAPGAFPARGPRGLRRRPPARRRAHRGPELLPGQHAAGLVASRPARPARDPRPDHDHLGRGRRLHGPAAAGALGGDRHRPAARRAAARREPLGAAGGPRQGHRPPPGLPLGAGARLLAGAQPRAGADGPASRTAGAEGRRRR